MGGSRNFYEKYFVELEISAEEKLKQLWRVELLQRATSWLPEVEKGLFVGIGKGLELEARVEEAFTVGLDLPFTYLPMIKNNLEDENVAILQGDGTKLPFDDDTFDYILCSEVLEHVPNRADMISEYARVLKPGGHVIITTPNWISCYGLARKLVELISRRDIHADDQPLDKWITLGSLKSEFGSHFEIEKSRGFWYYPPIGRGSFQILPGIFSVLWRILKPFERLNSALFPGLGHCVLIYGKVKK
ncbi:MAG: class I SAM-dependent methyltransferase [Candidatus Zixiibacteriota bacterium]